MNETPMATATTGPYAGTPSVLKPVVAARKFLGAKAIRGLFYGAAGVVRHAPIARPARHDVEVIRNVPYLGTGLVKHTYDVYRPKTRSGPLPMMLYIHGGAFRTLSKETHWIMGLGFARRGFVVVVPNYRLAPEHRYPSGSADVVAALRHAVDHADRYDADASQLVLAGESAGANMALGLTVARSWDLPAPHIDPIRDLPIAAVIPACGVFQVDDPDRFRRRNPGFHWFFHDRVHELPDWLPRRDGEAYADPIASPLPWVEKHAPVKPVPPLFLPVGGGDFLLDDHGRLASALKRHGVPHEMKVYGSEPHAFHAFVWREHAQACWRDMADFLRRRGNLTVREPPPVR